MKKKLCMLFAIVLLLVGGCNEKSQNYFTGTILKITDNYFIVSPDDSEPIRETGDMILVRAEQNELIYKLDLAVSFCKSERMGIYDIAKLT